MTFKASTGGAGEKPRNTQKLLPWVNTFRFFTRAFGARYYQRNFRFSENTILPFKLYFLYYFLMRLKMPFSMFFGKYENTMFNCVGDFILFQHSSAQSP